MKIQDRIWFKLLILLSAAAGIPLLIFYFLSIQEAGSAVIQTMDRDRKFAARRGADEIRLFLDKTIQIIRNTAKHLETMKLSAWQKETLLMNLTLYNRDLFNKAYLVAPDASVVVSTQGTPATLGKRQADFFGQLRDRGRVRLSGVEISREKSPLITVSAPVMKFNKPRWFLLVEVNLRDVWKLTDRIDFSGKPYYFRTIRDGGAILINSSGFVISHWDKTRVFKNVDPNLFAAIGKSAPDQTYNREYMSADAGRRYISCTPVTVPGMGRPWILIVDQPLDQAFSLMQTMRWKVLIIFVVTALVFILLAVPLSRNFTRPLTRLTRAADRVSAGSTDEQIEVNRSDEFGEFQAAFNQMVRKLEQIRRLEKLSAVGFATSRISHKLRNPLATIHTFISSFNRKKDNPEFIERFERIVPGQVTVMREVMDEFANLTREIKLSRTRLNLSKLLQKVADEMSEKSAAEGIEIRLQLQTENTELDGDPRYLHEVFSNLIQNAIEAMTQGGSITVSLECRDPQVIVRVADTGPGIAPEEQKKIFEPFCSGKRKGMGMGLAITRSVIEKHGGKIRVESEPGNGAEFIVTFRR